MAERCPTCIQVTDSELATRADRYREALERLADPESWHGDPLDQHAWLLGHDTPYEVARAALHPEEGESP